MNQSPWKKSLSAKFPKLTDNSKRKTLYYDVIIIGGGVTGLTTAFLLKQAGKKVCLLERDAICSGDTGFTTAHLTAVTDTQLSDLVSSFGKESTRAVWNAGEVAIRTIEDLVEHLNIDCDFKRVPGFLYCPLLKDATASDIEKLKKDADVAADLGITAHFEKAVPIVGKPGVRFPNQAKIAPLKYLSAIATAIPGEGSVVYEHSPVTKILSDPLAVECGDVRIETGYLVIATHVPMMGIEGTVSASLFQTKIASYSSYVVGAEVPKGMLPETELWDTSDPYFYLRVDKGPEKDYVIFGGLDHKTGQVSDTESRYLKLEEILRGIIPSAHVKNRWSGQIIETHDGLPFIGENAENQFIATGYCGNGFTLSTLAAVMARDAITHQENPWTTLFSPSRKEIRAGGLWNYVKENIDYPYYLLRDRVVDQKKEQGWIIEKDGEKMACSRDDAGNIHIVSAVCTHMGCLVHWNQAGESWDCPCHGSRFKPDGSVIAGPAEEPLKPVRSVRHEKRAS